MPRWLTTYAIDYLRTGDEWTKIDYKKKPSEWMKPLIRGQETGLVEIPANWYLDDLPPMMFIKDAPNSVSHLTDPRLHVLGYSTMRDP